MATHLHDLPLDIMDNITSRLHSGADTLNLWKCGDMVLNQKCCHGGVTTLTLHDLLCISHAVRIPTIISKLQRLHKLRIKVTSVVIVKESFAVLKQLPPTLRHLSLVFRNVDHVLREVLANHPKLEYLQIEETVTPNGGLQPLSLISANVTNLLPQELHTLKLSWLNVQGLLASSKTDFVPPLLPPGLTYLRLANLDIRYFIFDNDHGFVPTVVSLPPHLQRLQKYRSCEWALHNSELFIDETTRAKSDMIHMYHIQVNALPPTLLALNLSFLGDHDNFPATSPLHLPLHLHTLEVYIPIILTERQVREFWHAIPRSVTKLLVHRPVAWNQQAFLFTPKELHALLPPNLVSFAINVPLPIDSTAKAEKGKLFSGFWPESLQRLVLPIDVNDIPSFILPSSLRVLHLSDEMSRSTFTPLHPLSMQEANVLFISLQHLVDLDLGHVTAQVLWAIRFPPLLQHLEMWLTTEWTEPVECLVLESLARLPATLTSLNFWNVSHNDMPSAHYQNLFAILPRHLVALKTKIILSGHDYCATRFTDIFACLPPQLQSLDVGIHNTDANVQWRFTIEHMNEIRLSMLPSQLRTLKVLHHYFSARSLDVVMPHLRLLVINKMTTAPYKETLFPKLEIASISHLYDLRFCSKAILLADAEPK